MRKIKLIKTTITMLTIGVLLMGNVCKAAETGGYVETVKTGESTLFGPLYKARAIGERVFCNVRVSLYKNTSLFMDNTRIVEFAESMGKRKGLECN